MLDVNAMLNKMGLDASQAIVLPEEGTGGGFIASLWASYVRSFRTQGNVAKYNKEVSAEEAIIPFFMQVYGDSGWSELYWAESEQGREQAEKARKALGEKYPASAGWYATLNVADVVNLTEESKGKFKLPEINAKCRVRTFKSKKYRHEYQLICLPKAVAAVAQLYRVDLGIAEDIDLSFDTSELDSLGVVVKDETYEHLCGDPDDSRGYATSLFWQRRVELWAKLGEIDAHKYQIAGSGQKQETVSPALNACLTFLATPWPKKLWGRFEWLKDPRPDATRERETDDSLFRNQLPGLVKLYFTEADARADADMPDGEQDASAATTTASNEPPVPAAWAGVEEEWRTNFVDTMADWNPSASPKDKLDKARSIGTSLGATPGEVLAWASYLENV